MYIFYIPLISRNCVVFFLNPNDSNWALHRSFIPCMFNVISDMFDLNLFF